VVSNAFRYDCSHSSFFRAILLSALLSVDFVGYFSFFANKMMQILFGCLSCYSAVSIKALMGNRIIDHNQGNHSLDFILYCQETSGPLRLHNECMANSDYVQSYTPPGQTRQNSPVCVVSASAVWIGFSTTQDCRRQKV